MAAQKAACGMKVFNKRLFVFLLIQSIVSVAVYCSVSRSTGNHFFDFLVWNLFLAWIPFLLSNLAMKLDKSSLNKKIYLIWIAGGFWLLFFPNSPYIVTDLIHLTVLKNNYAQNGRLTFKYWYDFLLIILFTWNGLLLGVASMYQIHSLLYKKANAYLCWFFIAAASVLGGYGILLGREYRLNSWDIATDFNEIRLIVLQSFNYSSILFCMLFGLVIASVYITFYFFLNGFLTSDSRRGA